MTDFKVCFIEKNRNEPSDLPCSPSHVSLFLLIAIEMAIR